MTLPKRYRFSQIACLALMLGGWPAPAAVAQQPAATINGKVITTTDAQQRQRIAAVLEGRNLTVRQAIDEAINDQLKIQEGERLGFRVSGSILDESYGRLARSNGGLKQFGQALRQAGINETALKSKLAAEIAWDAVLRSAARRVNRLSNAELNAAIERKKAEGRAVVTDYQLQAVVFIVPGGAGTGARETAKARAARKGFTGCETGFDALRGTIDVAVKPPFARSSSELAEATVKMLNATPVGQLTEPYPTPEGIEMIAVCSRKDRQDLAAAREKIDQEASSQAMQARASAILEELRSKASIEYRR